MIKYLILTVTEHVPLHMKRADHFADITYEKSCFHALFRASRLMEISADRETWSCYS